MRRARAGGAGGRGGTGGAAGGRGGTGGGAAGGRGGTGGGAVGGGNGSWQLLAPMPSGARQEHCVAALGGLVYAIGSYNGNANNQRLEAYDPATNTWSTKAMMPFGGDHCNAAATATKLYVLGATGTTQSAEYDPVANSWTMKRPIPTQRAAAATAAIGDKIYVAGGMSTMGRNVTVREFAAYDSVTDTWEILPDLPESSATTARRPRSAASSTCWAAVRGRPTIPRRACSIASTRTIRPPGCGARRRRCRAPAVGRRRV